MAALSQTPNPSPELDLYYARDPVLDDLLVLVFYGPSTTANTTFNSSRVQAHIFSAAGYGNLPRLTIAPTSPVYAAVHSLPADLQGDEVARGLAVSLLSYFRNLPPTFETYFQGQATLKGRNGGFPKLFSEAHAGELAASMELADGKADVLAYLQDSLQPQRLPWLDLDVFLPQGALIRARDSITASPTASTMADGCSSPCFGKYDKLINATGTPLKSPVTRLKRTPSRPPPHGRGKVLSRDGKIALRREMCEFVDTESNYASKIDELVDVIASACRQCSPELSALFPKSLNNIRHLSRSFLADIQSSLDQSEDEAIRDIEDPQTAQPGQGYPSGDHDTDRTGALNFAHVLLDWFPRFKDAYQDYLMASSSFGDQIARATEIATSTQARIIKDIGEQRLRSALIEPVQRLPRYNLIIDSIISVLPSTHASMISFLKARDVIKEICALDIASNTQGQKTMNVLCSMGVDWAGFTCPLGRLVSAVDVLEVSPPFACSSRTGDKILLLFTDSILVLEKHSSCTLTARGIMAELDRPSLADQFGGSLSARIDKGLRLALCCQLQDLILTESHGDLIVHMTASPWSTTPSMRSSSQTLLASYYLLGSYENKASRLIQEFALSRIEGRLSDATNGDDYTSLRTLVSTSGCNLAVSFSETSTPRKDRVPTSAFARGWIDDAATRLTTIPSSQASLTVVEGFIACSEDAVKEIVLQTEEARPQILNHSHAEPFVVLVDRVVEIFTQRYTQSPDLNHAIFSRLLCQMPVTLESKTAVRRPPRPISPVKLLSKMLSGPGTHQRNLPEESQPSLGPKKTFSFKQPARPLSVSEDQPLSVDAQVSVVGADSKSPANALALLEDTLVAYIVGIRSQSGNVLGNQLRNRAFADELAINELYNSLMEDPSRAQLAATAPVEVVFAAFEKFLRRGWRERMGPLVSPLALQQSQMSMDGGDAARFAQDFRALLSDMTPQNRRGFSRVIGLLSELLDASGSDGDRGILIASFAEALVLAGKPHDYINLFDRLVDDYDVLFEDATERGASSSSAASSMSRNRSHNKGSYSSNSSSFRKKFGLGGSLKRQNSKSELESKVGSLIRNWGKSIKGQDVSQSIPSSPSKISLVRSKSTDTAPQLNLAMHAFGSLRIGNSNDSRTELSTSRPTSSERVAKANISDAGATSTPNLPKRNRRSSLSDLTLLQTPDVTSRSPLQPRNLNILDRSPFSKAQATSPSRAAVERENASPKQRATNRNGAAGLSPAHSRLHSRAPSTDILITTSQRGQKTQSNLSPQLGTAHGSLQQLQQSDKAKASIDHGRAGSPPKMRVQSPKKLRQRLTAGNLAMTGSSSDLQAEIDRIGLEMGNVERRDTRTPGDTSGVTARELSDRLDRVSQELQVQNRENVQTYDDLKKNYENTLAVADKRARKLEELYREANAENEALYQRFNDELGKVLGRIRKGEGVDEVRDRLTDALKEVGSLKTEKARLKREVAELQSRVPE